MIVLPCITIFFQMLLFDKNKYLIDRGDVFGFFSILDFEYRNKKPYEFFFINIYFFQKIIPKEIDIKLLIQFIVLFIL